MGISDQWVAFFHAVILDPKFSHPIALHCNLLLAGRRTKEGIEGPRPGNDTHHFYLHTLLEG